MKSKLVSEIQPSMMATSFSPMQPMDVFFPGSSDQFVLNLVCCVQELFLNNDLKAAHQILAEINLLIMLKVIP